MSTRSPASLRLYQEFLCSEAKGKNIIVLLPTGAGKTVVGAEIMREKLEVGGGVQRETMVHAERKGCLRPRLRLAVFLVPTCFLVEQQAQAIRAWFIAKNSTLRVEQYHGDFKFPQLGTFDVLVSTPEAFRMKQRRLPSELGWDALCLLVFDEVHHVLKDHPYRKLALALQRHHAGGGTPVQVVGLTALLTYAVTPAKIERAKNQLCRELGIQAMPYVPKTDLLRDGFHAGTAIETEVRDEVEVPEHFEAHKVEPEHMRKPHLVHKTFWRRITDRTATSFALNLVSIVRLTEAHLKIASSSSPLSIQKLAAWGEYANQRAHAHRENARPALEQKFLYLEHLYEALRMVVLYWEEPKGCELAVLFLNMMGEKTGISIRDFPRIHDMGSELSRSVCDFFDTYDAFPQLTHLIEELLRQHEARPTKLRAVIFVQQKTTAHILAHHLNHDEDLRELKIEAVPLHSTTTAPPTKSITFTKADEKRNLNLFSRGLKQILVSTSVAEEGMDVGEANCVIRFDPPLTGVSFVQARGRARQKQSAHVITAQRSDRTVEKLQAVEEKQAEMAATFSPCGCPVDSAKEKMAQRSRERGALKGLKPDAQPKEAASILNIFCKQTKTCLGERLSEKGDELSLVYTSCLRTVRVEQAVSPPFTKQHLKLAKQQAAAELVKKLLHECCPVSSK
eukprot:gb/GEZN01003629.1/.p1 GENE.gb/GEZN01003629.1/~~gb/GEZN01003629.1/.p1  ORF type:complete len:678 (+),score=89.10 gb/GEZN01003629.1/:25-2058(+)